MTESRPKCEAHTAAGLPCGRPTLRAGPDPDGVWRCVGHSRGAAAEARREANAQAGANVAHARKQKRQRIKRARRAASGAPDDLDFGDTEAESDNAARARELRREVQEGLDLRTQDGRARLGEIAVILVSMGELEPRESDAWAKWAKHVARDTADEGSKGGTSVEFYLDAKSKPPEPPAALLPAEILQ